MKLAPAPAHSEVDEPERLLLELRAAHLRRRGVDDDDRFGNVAGAPVAAFRAGDRTIAVPLEIVRAAVPLRSVTPVPLAPAHTIGVLRFRGSIVPVVSLASLLGVRGWRVDPAVLLVVDGAAGLVAIDCEEIPRAATVARTSMAAARVSPTSLLEVDGSDGRVWLLADPAALAVEGARAD